MADIAGLQRVNIAANTTEAHPPTPTAEKFPLLKYTATNKTGQTYMPAAPLSAKAGCPILDPGNRNTAILPSNNISHIDGAKGRLRYRGYDITPLAKDGTFTEVAYLIMNGELPTQEELSKYNEALKQHTHLPPQVVSCIKEMDKETHPMNMLIAACSSLLVHDQDFKQSNFDDNKEDFNLVAKKIIAKFPLIVAHISRQLSGKEFNQPKPELGLIENFLHLVFSEEDAEFTPSPSVLKAIDSLLILHAEHGNNNSAAMAEIAESSHAAILPSLIAAIVGLSGPLHGGANEDAFNNLVAIQETHKNSIDKYLDAYLVSVKEAEGAGKPKPTVPGIGHRVYKVEDPRAQIIREFFETLLSEIAPDTPLFKTAKNLADKLSHLEDFTKRNLYPNVDFYSGVIYNALGFPPKIFTVLFALARVVGWLAHWEQAANTPKNPIFRPAELGNPWKRDYIPLRKRSADL